MMTHAEKVVEFERWHRLLLIPPPSDDEKDPLVSSINSERESSMINCRFFAFGLHATG